MSGKRTRRKLLNNFFMVAVGLAMLFSVPAAVGWVYWAITPKPPHVVVTPVEQPVTEVLVAEDETQSAE